jgi:hypothetical protein
MKRMTVQRLAIIGVMALGLTAGAALVARSSAAQAAESEGPGGPNCITRPCPPPK